MYLLIYTLFKKNNETIYLILTNCQTFLGNKKTFSQKPFSKGIKPTKKSSKLVSFFLQFHERNKNSAKIQIVKSKANGFFYTRFSFSTFIRKKMK